jgi:hypothetical protein
MRFWRYHDIGEGFLTDIQIDQVDQNLQYDVCILFDSEFSKGRLDFWTIIAMSSDGEQISIILFLYLLYFFIFLFFCFQ